MTIYDDIERIKKQIEVDANSKPLNIALFGQPGSGKSSLINRLIGKKEAVTGASTDVTKKAHVYEYGQLRLVDLPGYGTSKFPPNAWVSEFNPEDYDLFLCVFSGKFHEADTKFFQELSAQGRVCLFVRNMTDQLWEEGKTLDELKSDIVQDVRKQVGSKVTVYFTSCKELTGFDTLQDAIQASLEPAMQDKYTRNAKAYTQEHLEKKKTECKKLLTKYAAISAANGINPLPGVDVSVDFSMMFKLFSEIRKIYGLNDERINNLTVAVPLAKKVLDYATKEGLALLLKRFATKTILKNSSKFIPLVGQIIAASAGFTITLAAGTHYLNDCHELASTLLNEELENGGF
jgi:GTP-binding protein EngB required for normal cell division/uncharacterized protein (DUF697 family)